MTVHRSAATPVYEVPPTVLCGAKAEAALRLHAEADVNTHFRIIREAFKK